MTILFSDIVTFTKIAAAVQPMQVVGMLNELYSKFDHLTSVHGVYKVWVQHGLADEPHISYLSLPLICLFKAKIMAY